MGRCALRKTGRYGNALGCGGSWATRTGATRVRLLTLGLLMLGLLTGGAAQADQPRSYIITEAATGHVLEGERSRLRRQPASLTKMMTLYMVFEALDDGRLTLDQRLVTSRHAASMPRSSLGLRYGDRITVRDAIRASAVRSANDAAVVLAEALGGTESEFAQMMTRRARALGMRDTTFRNASGLTARGHLSTARDMAILSRRLWLDHQRHYGIFSERRVSVLGRALRNTNRLLGVAPGVDGIKTGYTARAGFNLSASAVRGGRRVIVVYMGGSSASRRNAAVTRLLDDGFALLSRLDRRRATRRGSAAVEWAPRPVRRPVAPRGPGEPPVVLAIFETRDPEDHVRFGAVAPQERFETGDIGPRDGAGGGGGGEGVARRAGGGGGRGAGGGGAARAAATTAAASSAFARPSEPGASPGSRPARASDGAPRDGRTMRWRRSCRPGVRVDRGAAAAAGSSSAASSSPSGSGSPLSGSSADRAAASAATTSSPRGSSSAHPGSTFRIPPSSASVNPHEISEHFPRARATIRIRSPAARMKFVSR